MLVRLQDDLGPPLEPDIPRAMSGFDSLAAPGYPDYFIRRCQLNVGKALAGVALLPMQVEDRARVALGQDGLALQLCSPVR